MTLQMPDLILRNGKVFCGLQQGFVQAVAIGADRILAVGSDGEIDALAGPETTVIDLTGRAAVPGLNEAHMHVVHVGLGMVAMNLRSELGFRDLGSIFARISDAVSQTEPGEWISGRGYDHNELAEGRHPTIEELDRIAPDNPLYIERTCGHMAVANTAAMRAAGIEADTPQPEGGLIEKVDGRLTGLLAERAMRLIVDVKPKPTVRQIVDAIERCGHHLLSQGFTSAMDAATGILAGMDELTAYDEAAASGRLPMRTWICIYGNPDDGIGPQAYDAGYRAGLVSGNLRIGAMKIFADGSAGALTAAMSEAYLVGDPANRGILTFPQSVMRQNLAAYHAQGYQLAIHAIGDLAIEQVLSGIEAASTDDAPIDGRRHRIEHCGFLNDGQLARMVDRGIDPVPQPVFIYEFGDLYVQNVGEERAAKSYPMRKWIDAGLRPAASSDAPVCATDPFKNLYTMITRKTRRGTVIGADQALSLQEAVHAYTALGAYTQFAEAEKGLLLPGYLADVAVLSRDIFSSSPEEIRDDTQCDLTILGGKVVFDRSAAKGEVA